MKLTDLTDEDFRKIRKILIKKDRLQGRIAKLNEKLESIAGEPRTGLSQGKAGRRRVGRQLTAHSRTQPKKGKAAKANATRTSIGLTGKITLALKGAGKKGLHIRVLAKTVKSTPASIRNWWYITGKKITEIKRVAPATYALIGE
jgi:hypothetical protein